MICQSHNHRKKKHKIILNLMAGTGETENANGAKKKQLEHHFATNQVN